MDKSSHSRLISLSIQKQKLESSDQKNILHNLSSHLGLPTNHPTAMADIRRDADKIDATELMSDINTLTNPFNEKRRIDL